jgi:asparagine synthase (glutamine-hydrolysing)
MVLGNFFDHEKEQDPRIIQDLLNCIGFNNSIKRNFNLPGFSCHTFTHTNLSFDETTQVHNSNDLFILYEGDCFYQNKILNALEIADRYNNADLDFLNEIHGEFAIVLCDQNKHELILIRDHLGTIPLSFAQKNGSLFFSSDFIGLAKTLFGEEKIDNQYLQGRFYDYEVTYETTPHPSVRKTLPGHYVRVSQAGIEQIKYWFPEDIQTTESQSDLKTVSKKFGDFIDQSILNYCDSLKCTAHISGGLDSTYLASRLNSLNGDDKLEVFSWSPDETINIPNRSFDERKLIKKQANKDGFDVIYTNLSKKDYESFVKNWRCPSESVFEDQVLRRAREHGYNAIISGWGGDDFIGLRDEALYYESFKLFNPSQFFKTFRKEGFKNKVMHFVNNILFPRRRKPYLKFKMDPKSFKYLNVVQENKLIEKDASIFHSKSSYQLGMINYYHIANRCDDWYVNGQRNGIIYKYPLLDKRIVEYSLSLPVDVFISSEYDRPIMREITRNVLIDEIRTLQKQGDPMAMGKAILVQKEAMRELITTIDTVASCEDLNFIDFKELKSDLDRNAEGITNHMYYFLHQVFAAYSFVENYHDSAN